MQKGRKISWWVLRRVMVLHSFSCDCAKITVFVSTSFFQGQYLFLVVICSIDIKSKIAASIIMMTQQKTIQERSEEKKMLYLFLLKMERWCYWWLAKKKDMNLKLKCLRIFKFVNHFTTKRPMSLLFAYTTSTIMPKRSSGQVPRGQTFASTYTWF